MKKNMKKLTLSRETISMLNSSDLNAVQGGLAVMTHQPPPTQKTQFTDNCDTYLCPVFTAVA